MRAVTTLGQFPRKSLEWGRRDPSLRVAPLQRGWDVNSEAAAAHFLPVDWHAEDAGRQHREMKQGSGERSELELARALQCWLQVTP